jgi:Gluconate 2-dehydrogenase subunit 3
MRGHLLHQLGSNKSCNFQLKGLAFDWREQRGYGTESIRATRTCGTTDMDRRDLLKVSGASLAMAAAASLSPFDPRKARAEELPFKILSLDEVSTIEALAETLVPGARDAGVSHYIDHELASPSPRLLLRFAQLRGPLAPYYHVALAAFAASMTAQGNGAFLSLSPDAQHTVIEALRTGAIKPWDSSAVPPPVFYGMMRNDSVDVVYGSIEGFKQLDIPYMPHIAPSTTW